MHLLIPLEKGTNIFAFPLIWRMFKLLRLPHIHNFIVAEIVVLMFSENYLFWDFKEIHIKKSMEEVIFTKAL